MVAKKKQREGKGIRKLAKWSFWQRNNRVGAGRM
jgi:hypothetical protein